MYQLLEGLPPDSRVLDLGAGSGSFVPPRSDLLLVRLDLCRPHEPGEGSYVIADAAQMPFAGRSFDLIVSNHSLEHFVALHDTLKEMGRVVKPDGALYVAVPDAGTLTDRIYRWLGRGGGHVNPFHCAREVARPGGGPHQSSASPHHHTIQLSFVLELPQFCAPPAAQDRVVRLRKRSVPGDRQLATSRMRPDSGHPAQPIRLVLPFRQLSAVGAGRAPAQRLRALRVGPLIGLPACFRRVAKAMGPPTVVPLPGLHRLQLVERLLELAGGFSLPVFFATPLEIPWHGPGARQIARATIS